MEPRREFLKSAITRGVAGMVGAPLAESTPQTVAAVGETTDDRGDWLGVMERIATPVRDNLARLELKQRMPVEAANPATRWTSQQIWSGKFLPPDHAVAEAR